MKRSRYSATMSRCFGSSNQSRERKRRLVAWMVCQMPCDTIPCGSPGHVDANAEQAAGERLLLALFRIERDMRGGDVKRPQIVAGEGRLGHRGARQSQGLTAIRLAVSSAEAPAAEHAGPEATFGIDDRAVGISASPAPKRANTRLLDRLPVARAIECVDDSGQRIGVIQHAAVGALRRTVGHHVARIAPHAAGVGRAGTARRSALLRCRPSSRTTESPAESTKPSFSRLLGACGSTTCSSVKLPVSGLNLWRPVLRPGDQCQPAWSEARSRRAPARARCAVRRSPGGSDEWPAP